MKLATIVLCVLLAACWLPACSRNQDAVVVAEARVEVRDKPVPENYPSTNPIPYQVVGFLEQGNRARILRKGTDKDFQYFEVQLQNGAIGYVVSGDARMKFRVEATQ